MENPKHTQIRTIFGFTDSLLHIPNETLLIITLFSKHVLYMNIESEMSFQSFKTDVHM